MWGRRQPKTKAFLSWQAHSLSCVRCLKGDLCLTGTNLLGRYISIAAPRWLIRTR